MRTRQRLFAFLAWLQLVVSLLLATAIVWGYISYQASIGQLVNSLAASVGAVSNVVIRTAETVEARKDLLDATEKTLAATRSLLTALMAVAENLGKNAPKYADGLRVAANGLRTSNAVAQSMGDTLINFSVPNIHMNGLKPVITYSRPFDESGARLKHMGQDLKSASEALSSISETIGPDGQKLGTAVIATSEQALKTVAELEKTLTRLNTQDLPKAIADLRATSEALRTASAQVDMASNAGTVLLVVGLLLAAWCFVHSIGALLLIKPANFYSGRDTVIPLGNPQI
jgi:hypothetical protein